MENWQEKVAEKKSAYYNALAERAKYEQDAFSELYDYFFPRVYSYIFAKVKDNHTADDIISSTFEKVFLHLRDYDSGKGAFSTWIFRIALNEMSSLYRKQNASKETTWEEFFDPADKRATPEQQVVTKEGDRYLLCTLEKLPERERKIVSMKYFMGISNKEIAEALDMTPSNVGVILHRTLGKLKGMLEEAGYEM